MDFTHLEKLEIMENQSLFGWVHPEEASWHAPYLSESSFSVALYGGTALQYPTTEPVPELPLCVDPLHNISPIDAVPQLDHYHYYYHFQYCCREVPPLDDFNFDSIAWDDALLEPGGDAAAVTPSADDQHSAISSVADAYNRLDDISCEEMKGYSGSGISDVVAVEEKKQYCWMEDSSTVKTSSRSSSIGFDEVAQYFCMPIVEAARKMKVGLTVLKKRCRELGISRWPHRKMKSLNSLIRNVRELGKGVATEGCVRKEVETLEEHKRLMEMMPEMQLSERTKKLRQACFKANFKKRRAMQYYSCLTTHPSLLL